MVNNPQSEPYYAQLAALGYHSFNYSEKHYLFSKGCNVIKIARGVHNNSNTDESYYIEACAQDILLMHGLVAAKVKRIYEKGELVDGFVVLEEDRIDGQVFYRKDSDERILKQILEYMAAAYDIEGKLFGMMDKYGDAVYPSWQEFLISVISKAKEKDRENLLCELVHVPRDIKPSFIFTDCNTSNFIFESNKLKCAVDVERPLWGDRDFLYGVIKARNPHLFNLAVKLGHIRNMRLISLYSELYNYIFD